MTVKSPERGKITESLLRTARKLMLLLRRVVMQAQRHSPITKAPTYLPKVLLSLLHSHLNEAESFYRDVDVHYARELRRLDEEYAKYPKSYWDEDIEFGMTRVDILTDEYQQFKAMRQLNREFAVLRLYADLEQFFLTIFQNAKVLGLLPAQLAKQNDLRDFKEYVRMVKGFGIDLAAFGGTYTALNKLKEIRNAIVHHEGRVNRHNLRKLKCHGFKEEGPLELADDYLPATREVVSSTCEAIMRQYAAYLKGKGRI